MASWSLSRSEDGNHSAGVKGLSICHYANTRRSDSYHRLALILRHRREELDRTPQRQMQNSSYSQHIQQSVARLYAILPLPLGLEILMPIRSIRWRHPRLRSGRCSMSLNSCVRQANNSSSTLWLTKATSFRSP